MRRGGQSDESDIHVIFRTTPHTRTITDRRAGFLENSQVKILTEVKFLVSHIAHVVKLREELDLSILKKSSSRVLFQAKDTYPPTTVRFVEYLVITPHHYYLKMVVDVVRVPVLQVRTHSFHTTVTHDAVLANAGMYIKTTIQFLIFSNDNRNMSQT